jgi:hypothetical protein
VADLELARPEGLEPPAYWFEANRSIQLSYGRESHAYPITPLRAPSCALAGKLSTIIGVSAKPKRRQTQLRKPVEARAIRPESEKTALTAPQASVILAIGLAFGLALV